MAWSSAEISADEISLAAADKPILGSNAGMGKLDPVIATGWDWSLGNDAAQPATRVFDGLPGIRSSTTIAGKNHVLTLGFTSAIEFDFFAIIGHNFDTFGTFDLTVRVADDFAFTSNVRTISNVSSNPTDGTRIANLSLINASATVTITSVSTTASVAYTAHGFQNGEAVTISGAVQTEYNGSYVISNVSANAFDYTFAGSGTSPATGTISAVGDEARRYSSVLYVEIGMLLIDTDLKPTIGQVILGRRRQLKHEPNRPWDPTNLASEVDDFESRGGVTYRTARHTGRRMINADLTAYVTANQTDISSWFTETNYGANPFIWIDKPNSAPTGLYLMHQQEPSLSFPFIQWDTRSFTLVGKEQGPNFVSTE